jgi:pyruvate/2-oxoglutarate dehydrogenase complex dihydrolipoamide dehydrogenase (E3) component
MTTSVRRVEGTSGDAVRLKAMRGGVAVVIEGAHLLVAGGRTPNTDGIGLETAGVETDEPEHVRVNARLQTTRRRGIWS